MRKLKAFVAALMLATTLASNEAAGAQTGGAIIPCPGSPWGNGWFNTWNNSIGGSVNCSQQDNHIVLDVYNSQGIRSQAVIDIWYGSQCDGPEFIQPSQGLPFKIRMKNNGYGNPNEHGCGIHGVPVTISSGKWYQTYNLTQPNTIGLCVMRPGPDCYSAVGWSSTNPYGINGGPYTPVRFSGFSPQGNYYTFYTDISPLVSS